MKRFVARTISVTAIVAAAALLVACSPSGDETTGQSVPSSPGKIWIAGWKETSAMNVPRAGAAMIVNNNFIYMVGGVDGRNFLRSSEYAPILADGRIGEWRVGPRLIEDRGFTEAVVKNGYIYVVGGGNGPNGKHLLTTVERAKINPDGSLGPWRQEG